MQQITCGAHFIAIPFMCIAGIRCAMFRDMILLNGSRCCLQLKLQDLF